MKLIVVAAPEDKGKVRTVVVHLKLCKNHREDLEGHLNGLGISLNALVRRLVLAELGKR